MNPTTTKPSANALTARQEIDALYTPLDEALAQLHQRRANANLCAAVAEFHSTKPPTFLRNEPCAFFLRHNVSPNRELECFASTVRLTGLPPLCIEFIEDIFSSRNPEKCSLSCPVFEVSPNHFARLRILSSKAEHQRLCDLFVTNGMTLPAFHRALLYHALPEFNGNLCDFSEWFSAVRKNEFYYLNYLALFICNGILFENFVAADESELRFAREKVIPSFVEAVRLFGVRPLIVPLLPLESEGSDHWRCLSGSLYPYAVELLRTKP